VTHCGGPSFGFIQYRNDAPPTPFNGLPQKLPDDNAHTYAQMKQMLRRIGFSNVDIVTLVAGSHTLGGAHSVISPHATNKSFAPFDATPGVFDNDIFKQLLQGKCILNIDCGIGKDPEMKDIIELFAKDQDAFFQQYAESFNKMSTIGQLNNVRLMEVHVDISVHKNLEAEGAPLDTVNQSSSVSGHRLATLLAFIALVSCF
jgi:catalase (peroxidase I)